VSARLGECDDAGLWVRGLKAARSRLGEYDDTGLWVRGLEAARLRLDEYDGAGGRRFWFNPAGQGEDGGDGGNLAFCEVCVMEAIIPVVECLPAKVDDNEYGNDYAGENDNTLGLFIVGRAAAEQMLS